MRIRCVLSGMQGKATKQNESHINSRIQRHSDSGQPWSKWSVCSRKKGMSNLDWYVCLTSWTWLCENKIHRPLSTKKKLGPLLQLNNSPPTLHSVIPNCLAAKRKLNIFFLWKKIVNSKKKIRSCSWSLMGNHSSGAMACIPAYRTFSMTRWQYNGPD